MNSSLRSRRQRASWFVPVLSVAAIAAATVLPSAASAGDHPALPDKTPAQLLAAVQTARVTTLSGTIAETARLGLPALPSADKTVSLTWQTLVTGTHTARVWLDGPDKQRIAVLGQLAESDVVHNGRDLWTYASDTQKVGHTQLPARSSATPSKDLRTYTPQGAADALLKAIDPSTVVTVDRTARVAGQPAYTLVLSPRDSRSTVHKVLLAIDAKHDVPLRVQVFGAAAKPAFEIAFSSISFSRPAASVFAFTPPKGATVTTEALGPVTSRPDAPGKGTERGTAKSSPTVVGQGWASVLVVPAAADGGSLLPGLTEGSSEPGSSAASLLSRITTTLPNGDRLLRSALVNALMTSDGRVLVGAVSPAFLEQTAGQHG
jgi:outer membrane lipoprotein-sorting protein